jgi:signal transduction histidine kinase
MSDISLEEKYKKLESKYEKREARLVKIMKISDNQEKKVMLLNDKLNEYKVHLEQLVEDEIKKREEKEKMLLQQSKLAAMGEMMDAVAHQWKQPINIINMEVDMMGYDFEDGLINQGYINQFQDKISSQVKHMTSTLNEFRSFFRPNKEVAIFNVKEMVDKVLLLIKDEFVKNQIEIIVDDRLNFTLNGIENEFKHLILNIINNAKDAFNENDIKNRIIMINIIGENNRKRIEIIDNAGGIPEHVIDDIFKANVTTKEEGKGTGIGLYMSNQIAQKHNGKLSVSNIENGAKFIFELI